MTRPNQRDRIYDFIKEEYQKNGFSPSIGEIAAHLSLSAKSNIHRQLQQLVLEGRLENLGGRYVPKSFLSSSVVSVPLLGKVAAGIPITAVENLDGYVAYIPRHGENGQLFALKIQGDSMTGAGILDGDIVIIEKTPDVQNGEIAVALIDDDATVKTFYREDGHIRLQPENPDYNPIIIKDVIILGRVLASMRYIKNRKFYR